MDPPYLAATGRHSFRPGERSRNESGAAGADGPEERFSPPPSEAGIGGNREKGGHHRFRACRADGGA